MREIKLNYFNKRAENGFQTIFIKFEQKMKFNFPRIDDASSPPIIYVHVVAITLKGGVGNNLFRNNELSYPLLYTFIIIFSFSAEKFQKARGNTSLYQIFEKTR